MHTQLLVTSCRFGVVPWMERIPFAEGVLGGMLIHVALPFHLGINVLLHCNTKLVKKLIAAQTQTLQALRRTLLAAARPAFTVLAGI